MQVIRRRIRGFFALQAILLLLVVVVGIIRPPHISHAVRYFGSLALFLLAGVVFAMAFWTTRKPSAYRNPWAIAASIFSLMAGAGGLLLDLFVRHSLNLESAGPSLLILAIGAGGLYFFGQSGAAPTIAQANSESEASPEPVVAKKKPVPVAGDRTHPSVNLLVSGLTLAAEVAAIFYWSHWASAHGLTHKGALPWFILFTAAVLISTMVHESGHAFFAWGAYMKLLSFNAGPLRWHKTDGEWKFKFYPAGFVDLGGSVRAIPTNPQQPRIHELWTIFAGPLFNILFGLLLFWAIFNDALPYADQTWRLAAFTASFCFIAAITNLLPFMTEDGGYSDGARLLQIVTKSPLDEYHRTLNSLAATTVTQQRYRDLDVDAIERAAARFPNELRGLNLHLCAANCYFDNDRLPAARAALASAETIYSNNSIDLPRRLHPPFVIGHAYLNLDAAAARLWWDRLEAKDFELPNVDYWLAQTALFWVEGRQQEAEQAWYKANEEAQSLPEFGSGDFDRDRCALLRKQLAETPPVPAPQAAVQIPISTPALAATPAPTLSPSPVSTRAERIASRRAAIEAAESVPAAASPILTPIVEAPLEAPFGLANFSLADRIAPSRRVPDVVPAPVAAVVPIDEVAPEATLVEFETQSVADPVASLPPPVEDSSPATEWAAEAEASPAGDEGQHDWSGEIAAPPVENLTPTSEWTAEAGTTPVSDDATQDWGSVIAAPPVEDPAPVAEWTAEAATSSTDDAAPTDDLATSDDEAPETDWAAVLAALKTKDAAPETNSTAEAAASFTDTDTSTQAIAEAPHDWSEVVAAPTVEDSTPVAEWTAEAATAYSDDSAPNDDFAGSEGAAPETDWTAVLAALKTEDPAPETEWATVETTPSADDSIPVVDWSAVPCLRANRSRSPSPGCRLGRAHRSGCDRSPGPRAGRRSRRRTARTGRNAPLRSAETYPRSRSLPGIRAAGHNPLTNQGISATREVHKPQQE